MPLPSLGFKPLPPVILSNHVSRGSTTFIKSDRTLTCVTKLLREVVEGLYFRTTTLCPSPDVQDSAEAKYLNHINLAQALICRVLAGQPQEISSFLSNCATICIQACLSFTWSVQDLMTLVGQGVAKWAG